MSFLLLSALALAGDDHHDGHRDDHHGGHHAHEGGEHSHGHDDDATVTHSFADAEAWAKVFDDPERAAWQKPAELVAALELAPGSTVADIGAGTGYFNPHLSGAVGDSGKVIAVDIEATLVEYMNQRAATEGTANVEVRLGAPDDPKLAAGEASVVLLVDTYHHIDDRIAYFGRLLDTVSAGGRLVVVDFKPGDIPVGPPEAHRIPQEQVVTELVEAGWVDAGSLELLPYQFVQIVRKP